MKRCNEAVPRSLVGGLGPSCCSLETGKDGKHLGDHKAHKMVPHVGRITWKWKNRNQSSRSHQPPVVELPVPRMERAPIVSGEAKRCRCPDWRTGHLHVPPCPLVMA